MEELGDVYEFLDESDEESELPGEVEDEMNWRFVPASKMPEICLANDPVDEELLLEAKSEFRAVCANARQIFNSATNVAISMNVVSNYFLDSIILFISEAVKEGMTANEVSCSGTDIAMFIRILAYLSIYSTTPTNFFDPDNAFFYPMAHSLDRSAFQRVMKALGTNKKSAPTEVSTWDSAFKTDDLVRRTERSFTQAS